MDRDFAPLVFSLATPLIGAGEGRVSTDIGRSKADILLHEFLLRLLFTL